MTSERPGEAFVWCWLPGAEEPVVAGRVWNQGDILNFNYGQSYLNRADAIPLYLPELPLQEGAIPPLPGLRIAGCIADAMPDGWGRQVVHQHLLHARPGEEVDELDPLTYLLLSGSDRIGALDFQPSPDAYAAHQEAASLEELLEAAERVDRGERLSPALDRALLHGSSVGGARPKALVSDQGRSMIAKFSSTSDGDFSVVKAEFVAMELARRAGLDVAPVRLLRVLGKDVLLVERFDRVPGSSTRRALVSALTILGLPEESRPEDWSYVDLAEEVRARFTEPRQTLAELFTRITFNILVSNTDDHPRNHSAFWDGSTLTLTPAYDITPQRRGGGSTNQLMAIARDGRRTSQLQLCIESARTYHLSPQEAHQIIDHQIEVIETSWAEVCEAAELTEVERTALWRRQFLNPFALEGYGAAPSPP